MPTKAKAKAEASGTDTFVAAWLGVMDKAMSLETRCCIANPCYLLNILRYHLVH
jgi:hypothetical protein